MKRLKETSDFGMSDKSKNPLRHFINILRHISSHINGLIIVLSYLATKECFLDFHFRGIGKQISPNLH